MRIAIIGAGNMGGALARGLAKGSIIAAKDIVVSNPGQAKLDALKSDVPEVTVTHDNRQAAKGADVVLLAVKPWLVGTVVEEIKDVLDYSCQTLASVAAGINTAQLGAMLDRGDGKVPPIYWLIPNTAIAVGHSMTFVASAGSTPEMDAKILAMLQELGDAMLIEERLMGAGTALASCGIAYALRYIRAATEGGVELGFRAGDAQRIVAQTLKGAAALLEGGNAHAETEIDKVTTPGGLTIKGLNAMEEAGFTASVIKGLRASMK